MTEADALRVLGLSPGASEEDIKAAYRNLVKLFHPDRQPGNPHAEDAFKAVGQAYAALKDTTNATRPVGREPRPVADHAAGMNASGPRQVDFTGFTALVVVAALIFAFVALVVIAHGAGSARDDPSSSTVSTAGPGPANTSPTAPTLRQ